MPHPLEALLLATVFMSVEYGLRQSVEGLPRLLESLNFGRYGLYRLLQAVALAALLAIVFKPGGWLATAILLAGIIGSAELAFAQIGVWLNRALGLRGRRWHLLGMAGFVWLAWWLADGGTLHLAPWVESALRAAAALIMPTEPRPSLIAAIACVYLLLAHPANLIVRCLIDKASDRFLGEAVLASARGSARLAGLASDARPEVAARLETAAAADRPAGHGVDAATLKAGRVIGILERWLLAALLILGQYGLIGLILTAKSVTRFRQLDEAEFAEYYLLGTLYSLLLALAGGLAIRAVVSG